MVAIDAVANTGILGLPATITFFVCLFVFCKKRLTVGAPLMSAVSLDLGHWMESSNYCSIECRLLKSSERGEQCFARAHRTCCF